MQLTSTLLIKIFIDVEKSFQKTKGIKIKTCRLRYSREFLRKDNSIR